MTFHQPSHGLWNGKLRFSFVFQGCFPVGGRHPDSPLLLPSYLPLRSQGWRKRGVWLAELRTHDSSLALWGMLEGRTPSLRPCSRKGDPEITLHRDTHTDGEELEAPVKNPRYQWGWGNGCWIVKNTQKMPMIVGICVCTCLDPSMFLQTRNPSSLSLYLGKLKGPDWF